jgi:Putative F0F1-ATPase subunit Ca2+/Mg2+ transporter
VTEVRRKRSILQMGWMVALALFLPLGLGLWLDRRLDAAPLFVLGGALAGILAATVSAVWIAGREIEALGTPPYTGSDAGERQEEDKEDTA